jgi:hypothetical protein
MRLCVLRARARAGVSAVVCVGAPLRARVTHEITHLDGRAPSGPWRAPESCARCLAGAAVVSTLCVQRYPTMPLGVLEARMWSVSMRLCWAWACHSGPVQCSRWCIWMGEQGGAPESCARYLRCCCKHLLCAKGSHDVSVRVQARACIRAPLLAAAVLAWSCHSKPCNARDGAC